MHLLDKYFSAFRRPGTPKKDVLKSAPCKAIKCHDCGGAMAFKSSLVHHTNQTYIVLECHSCGINAYARLMMSAINELFIDEVKVTYRALAEDPDHDEDYRPDMPNEAKSTEQAAWKENMAAKLIPHDHWHIMLIIRDESRSLKYITSMYNPQNKPMAGTRPRDQIVDVLRYMISAGLVTRGDGHKGKYGLTEAALEMFCFEPDKIGRAPDIKEAVRLAVSYYVEKGCFLAMAERTPWKKYYTDMVAYDYNTDTPISVEIASEVEIVSHPEHVRLNMVKWPELGFRACHIWSFSQKLEDEYAKLKDGDIKQNTTAFIIDAETDCARIVSSGKE